MVMLVSAGPKLAVVAGTRWHCSRMVSAVELSPWWCHPVPRGQVARRGLNEVILVFLEKVALHCA